MGLNKANKAPITNVNSHRSIVIKFQKISINYAQKNDQKIFT